MNKYNLRQQVNAQVRRKRIMLLRNKGWTWVEIGRKYAISPQRAQQLGKLDHKIGRADK